jgi:hypothetical protein
MITGWKVPMLLPWLLLWAQKRFPMTMRAPAPRSRNNGRPLSRQPGRQRTPCEAHQYQCAGAAAQ